MTDLVFFRERKEQGYKTNPGQKKEVEFGKAESRKRAAEAG